MRVLLSTYGSRGDVEPLAALAVALRGLGVEAVVNAPPEDEFIDLLDRAGVAFSPAFMSVKQWIAEARSSPTPMSIPQLAARMIPLQYAALDAAVENCDAVVSTGLFPSTAAAQTVAERRGVPHVSAVFCPKSLPSHEHAPFARPGRPHPPGVTDPRALWALNTDDMNALFGAATNDQRTAAGLPATDDVQRTVFGERPLLASDPVIWPWVETDLSHPVQTGAWTLPDERPLADDLDAFLRAGPSPVYVGFGSISLPSTRDAAKIAIEALRARGRRVVVAGGWAGAEPLDDGDGCFLVGEVNQQALFPRVAAIVHHGGAGTVTTAARAGAPQVVVPQIVDQPCWGAHLSALGVGAVHDGAVPTVESLAPLLDIALDPATRTRAAEIAGRIHIDGVETAATLLVERIAGTRPGV